MMQQLSYAYKIEKGADNGFTVTFPDVPEAITGTFEETEIHALAYDALICALIGYIEENKTLPKATYKGKARIYLRPLEAAKVALYSAMAEKGMTQAALAHKLDIDARQVRRMLALDHSSKIESLNNTLRVIFGKRLVTSVMEAA